MALVHDLVAAGAPEKAEKWILFLHGILGSGANWRTFAKQLVAERPAWGAALVDLRLHGGSQEGFAPPDTVVSAAGDLASLDLPGPVRGVLGHSFGGKVALAYARGRRDLEQLFVVDATPSARLLPTTGTGADSTRQIVDMLMTLPTELPDRNAFMAWVEERGVSRPVAMWLAMNVRPIPGTTRYAFRIDVARVRDMLEDYFRTDLWDVLCDPEGRTERHLVVGGRSPAVDEAERERARRCPRTTVDVVADAGHWVHVDAPKELLALVLARL